MSTYTGVTNFQKTVRFFGPPCICRLCTIRGREQWDITTSVTRQLEYHLHYAGVCDKVNL